MDLARFFKPEAQTDITKQPTTHDDASSQAPKQGDPAAIDRILAAFQRQQAGEQDNVIPSQGGVSAAPSKTERDAQATHAGDEVVQAIDASLVLYGGRIDVVATRITDQVAKGDKRVDDAQFIHDALKELSGSELSLIAKQLERSNPKASLLSGGLASVATAHKRLASAKDAASARYKKETFSSPEVDMGLKAIFDKLGIDSTNLDPSPLKTHAGQAKRQKVAFQEALEAAVDTAKYLRMSASVDPSSTTTPHAEALIFSLNEASYAVDGAEADLKKDLRKVFAQPSKLLRDFANQVPGMAKGVEGLVSSIAGKLK